MEKKLIARKSAYCYTFFCNKDVSFELYFRAMRLVALTGGIACGKSNAVAYLLSKNVYVIDADRIARQVVEPGTSTYRKLRTEFGATFFDDENGGALRRQKLGELIFSDVDVSLFASNSINNDECVLEAPQIEFNHSSCDPMGNTLSNYSSFRDR